MVYTDMADFPSHHDVILNPGDDDAECVMGTLAANSYPAQWVWKTESTGRWTLADSDLTTYGTYMRRGGVVGYEKRVNGSTGALKCITDVWTYDSAGDKNVPIWTSGIVFCFITDQNTYLPAGTELMVSSATAGSLTVLALGALTISGGSALLQPSVATTAMRVMDGDLITIVGIGKCRGRFWGGYNETAT